MIKKLIATMGAILVAFGTAVGVAAPASAVNNIKPFGTEMTLKYPDYEIGFMVDGLSPSTEIVPYPIHGRLYEAMVTVNAIWGSAQPMVPWFSARAENGDDYPALTSHANPQGLNPASLPPGGSTASKLYFDVVGSDPNSVVYGDGVQDFMAWVG